ncbi:MAG: ABC transporter permease [Oscillospiraceae bacterium]|nr:ABC transporter permease [Oscillospiraceae bacterium]
MRNRFSGAVSAVAVFFALWYSAALLLNKAFLPTPTASFAAFYRIVLSGEITKHILISSGRVFFSLLIASLTAVPLGLWTGRNKSADRLLTPFIRVLYPLPKVVFLPIIVILTGIGNSPKIILLTLVIFFQVAVAARDASKSVPLTAVQSIRSLNAKKTQIYRHLVLPYALPQIFTSLRISLGTAVAVLFFAETFASADGVGYYISDAMSRRSYDLMFAGIIAMALLGLLFYAVIDLSEKYFCRWQKK